MNDREDSEFSEDEYYNQFLQKTDLALQLQRFLADVESKKNFPFINKDFGYTRLNEKDIDIMEQRFRTLVMAMDHLKKLSGEEDTDKLLRRFSAPQYLLGMNVSSAVLRQSRDGWARELTVTKKLLTKFNKMRYKFLEKEAEE